ncbi:hypothetical protein EG329_012996 [Mollisiaceae sp. DMI_Dod_QoI]|nr:hypothetical protein EG329_012996 [Helotiales sp. DMI_Dod_QoI]
MLFCQSQMRPAEAKLFPMLFTGCNLRSSSSSSVPTPAEPKRIEPEPLEDFLNRVNDPLHAVAHDLTLNVQLPNVLHLDESTNFLGTLQGNTDLIELHDPWLLASLQSQDTTPPLAKHSMQTLLRVFRSWPGMLAKGFQLPPIFHYSTKEKEKEKSFPLPLANCCTLVKMWYGQHEGSNAIVQDTILKEMKTIVANFRTYDETDLLAGLQATTIYIIMLIFPTKNQISIPKIDQVIFSNILDIVYHTASTGLVLQEETDHALPSWEAWVHITSKRRAVFSLYLLHWSYSIYHHLQSFNCSELGFMPAPAAKFLWEARSKEDWEFLYKKWLAQWDGCEYMQHEFGGVKPGVMLDERTLMWLEDTDELGVLFSSIFNTTDREPGFTHE